MFLFRSALLCFVCFLFCKQTCDMRCNKDTYSQSGCIEVDMDCMYLSIQSTIHCVVFYTYIVYRYLVQLPVESLIHSWPIIHTWNDRWLPNLVNLLSMPPRRVSLWIQMSWSGHSAWQPCWRPFVEQCGPSKFPDAFAKGRWRLWWSGDWLYSSRLRISSPWQGPILYS